MLPTLLQADTYRYVPFVTPLPLWNAWPWLLLPLCLAVAIVYKTMKVRQVGDLPREAGAVFLWIMLAMIGAAVGLYALVAMV